MNTITLGDSVLPLPDPPNFSIKETEIVREARLSSGLLVKDVIGTKSTFSLKWTGLLIADIIALVAEYEKHAFINFEYPDKGATQNATVTFKEFPRSLATDPDAEHVAYQDVTIVLEEQ